MATHVCTARYFRACFQESQKAADYTEANKMAGEVCDCANLQFIGEATKHVLIADPPNFQLARLVFAATTKVAFLWAKTSLTKLLWSNVGLIMKSELVFALVL